MKITLRVWRQKDGNSEGKFEEYAAEGLNPNMSFLEMLDVVNEDLIEKERSPLLSPMIVERASVGPALA